MSILAFVLVGLLLTLSLFCGLWLVARALREAGRELRRSSLGFATVFADSVPTDELRHWLLRGTSAATAAELGELATAVANDIDELTIKSGWGEAMKRWDTLFRVRAEKRSLRASPPQYRAARAIGQHVVADRCAALGVPPPLILPDDDLDATRDGSSSGVVS